MPSASDIDWPGIRAAAVTLDNVRAAARQAAANLPEPERTTLIERINKRAVREGWLTKAAAVQSVHRAETALSMPVQNGHQILEKTLADRKNLTNLGLSLYTARASRVASRLPKSELLASAPSVKAVADVAGKVWPEQQAGAQVLINIALLGRDLPDAVDV